MNDIDLEELRRKLNKNTVEEQIRMSDEFLRLMNPGVDISTFAPVDELTPEEEEYIREGLMEAERMRKEGKI